MFTDAAIAIAMTLLILPLMESAVEARDEQVTTLEWFQDNKDLLLTFFLSYMVIAMAWIDHDRLFRRVSYFNQALSVLNFLWIITIVFIPVATNIMNSVLEDALQHFIWIGTFLFAKLLTFQMTLLVHNRPEMWDESMGGPTFPQVVGDIVSLCLLTIALLVSMTKAGYWIMLIIVLRIPITRLIIWKWPSLKTKWQQTANKQEQSNGDDCTPNDDETTAEKVVIQDDIKGLVEAERRIIFTDAAAAIAMTLLILPLMDAGTEARGEAISTAEWFQENKDLLLSFFLSFLVISLCWGDQDRLVRGVEHFTWFLSLLNFLWLLAIVFIPVSTAVMNAVANDALQHFVYIGNPLLVKLFAFCMIIEVHRNPATWAENDGGPKFSLLLNSVVFIVLLVIALFVSMTAANYWILFLCVLKSPILKVILWKWPSLKSKW